MTTKLAELRRWSRKEDVFTGYVYNDPLDSYDDGEHAELPLGVLADCGSFFILRSEGKVLFKLYKDDQIHEN